MSSAPPRIVELVETFERNIESYKGQGYSEAQVRQQFINPFFEALGWDMQNKAGIAPAYSDVIHEDAIKVGAPDYCFRIGGTRKFFLEAKKPSVDISSGISPAYQLRRYAWSTKLPLSILTDFEDFAVYDCQIRPNINDKPSTARIFFCTYKDYADKWEQIASIFSKEAVLKGAFDKYASEKTTKRGTTTVDKEFLAEIEGWRNELAKDIALRNSKLSVYDLNFAVQKTIDRILFLRICEDRGIEHTEQLLGLINGSRIYPRLFELFEKADEKYNSGIFHFRMEKDRPEGPDEISANLKVDDDVLKKIIKDLYYPCPYVFSEMPVEILGNVYEQFLGKVIRLTAGHQAKVEEKLEVKKAGGVYYTPEYIVSYIVKNTVGKLCENKTPKQIEKLKILDPACGSGSFLIGAYRYLLDFHRDYYAKEPSKHKKVIYQGKGGQWFLTIDEKKRILLNNIYGVDIDSQAAEVTKLSLLLKVLENETQESLRLFHERALPDLGNNIKCGNSLIGPDFYQNQQLGLFGDEQQRKINAFDWQAGFPEIFKLGGFDAVIGNPPYVKARSYDGDKKFYRDYLNNNKNYGTLYKMWDIYIPFVEKGMKLLKDNGVFGMIVPDTIEKADYAELLRRWLLEKYYIYQIDFFPLSKIFYSRNKVVGIKNTIIFVQNVRPENQTKRIWHKKDYEQIDKIETAGYDINLFMQTSLEINLNRINTNNLGDICFTSYGLRLNSDKSNTKTVFKKSDLLSNKKTDIHIRKFTEGKNIKRYQIAKSSWVEWNSYRCPKQLVRPTFPELYEPDKILLGRQTKVAALDTQKHIVDNTIIACIPYWKLKGVDNNNISKYFKNINKPRIDLENVSEKYNLLYLLGILNSRLVRYYVRYLIQGGIDMFPDDWKKIPIPIPTKQNLITHDRMFSLVEQMLELNKKLSGIKNPDEKTRIQRQIDSTDEQIDKLVYDLYGLTADEIAIIEGKK